MHVIIAAGTAKEGRRAVTAICAMVELAGHGRCRPTIEVRLPSPQGCLL